MTVPETPAKISMPRIFVTMAVGLVSAVLFVLAPYAIVWLYHAAAGANPSAGFTEFSGFGWALTMGVPFVQGFAMGVFLGPTRQDFATLVGLVFGSLVLELLGAALLLREGVICLIIVAPFLLVLMFAGIGVGRIAARATRSRVLNASAIPLIALGVFGEALGPRPDHPAVVVDSVVVNAPPDYVWRYVLSYPENRTAPEYWLWRAGLPAPIQSVASAPTIGAARVCRFEDGIAFEERIVELTPNRVMTFDVTRQPDHPEVTGHFRFDRGQVRLTPNADGTTTVTATSWYRLYVRPFAYFDLWTADITRQVHFRVLNHMKRLAERDYRAAEAAVTR